MSQAGNVDNVVLGLCDVRFDGASLGLTKGEVVATITQNVAEITVDDFGNTPIAAYDLGTMIEVKVPLAEYTLANVNIALPMGTLDGDRVNVGRQAGTQLTYGELILDPLNANDLNITVYKAAAIAALNIGFTNDNIKVLEVTFKGFIDTDRPDGDQLFRIGGPAS